MIRSIVTSGSRHICTALTVALLFLICSGQQNAVHGSGVGQCPKHPPMPDFDMTRFLGHWYEMERSFYLMEIFSTCTTLNFRRGPSEQSLDVFERSINTITGPSEYKLSATKNSASSSIMDLLLETKMPGILAGIMPGSGRYQVLDTDYSSYAILWSCGSIGSVTHADQVWLLSRKREDFDVHKRRMIHSNMRQLGLDPERLMLSKNKNCGYF